MVGFQGLGICPWYVHHGILSLRDISSLSTRDPHGVTLGSNLGQKHREIVNTRKDYANLIWQVLM